MKRIIEHFIKYPIWVKTGLLLIFIFGWVGLKQMKTNFFTPIHSDLIKIFITNPGTSPEEIEKGIVIKIENNLKGIPGIEEIKSISAENNASFSITIKKGSPSEEVLQDVKNAVDRTLLPQNAEPPTIYKQPTVDRVATLHLTGDVSLRTLKNQAQLVQQDLMNISGISLVDLKGSPEEEIHINIDHDRLMTLHLTFNDIQNAIRKSNFDLTAGTIDQPTQEFIIRATQKKETAQELENIVITNKHNQLIRLKDIATIKEAWSKDSEINQINQTQSIEINITKTMDEDLLTMSKEIKSYLLNYNDVFSDTELILTSDRSNVLKQRISLLQKNGIIGFFLIIIALTIFISFRLSFWVAISIPISFLGMFFIGNLIGMTINVISLFGMIVVIGILVDDGIIISENIYQHYEQGKSPLQAAVDGTIEVLPSILSAILTTIVAFSPFYFIEGRSAEILSDVATVVIITLLVSIIECILFLPSHLAHSSVLTKQKKPNKIKAFLEPKIKKLKDVYFKNTLQKALKHKGITVGVSISLLILTIVAVKTGIIKTTFFPFIDSDRTTINVTLPAGTSSSETLNVLTKIESSLPVVNQMFKEKRKDNKDILLNVIKNVKKSGNEGSLTIELLDGETRNIESFEITQAIRNEVGTLPEVDSMIYGSRNIFGKPIVISFKGNDLSDLREAKSILKAQLSSYEKIKDLDDSDELGPPEIRLSFTPLVNELNLKPLDIMTQIRHGFYGLDVQKIQRNINEITVKVQFNEDNQNTISSLENMLIQTPNGLFVPLQNLATLQFEQQNKTIQRKNGMRELALEANLANEKDPLPPILNEINSTYLSSLKTQYPNLNISFEGQQKEQQKMGKSMGIVMPIMMITMFCIISLGFGSFSQTILIFCLLPFGFIGVAWGHAIHNMPINVMSTYGIIALIGIIVNDSIVLINTFNRNLKNKMTLIPAIIQASTSRFRPILLTSITTIAGLGPLILETSRQARFLIPMAISITYGLLFSTVFILILLPVFAVLFNHIKFWIYNRLLKTNKTHENIEPAIQEGIKIHEIS